MSKRPPKVTYILKSCITGRAVWIYQGQGAVYMAYWRASKKEIERIRNWPAIAARRKESIERLISVCMKDFPITAELTPEQINAVKKLKRIKDKGMECDRGFYDHIMETRERRRQDAEIRRQMRERELEKKNNTDYAK